MTFPNFYCKVLVATTAITIERSLVDAFNLSNKAPTPNLGDVTEGRLQAITVDDNVEEDLWSSFSQLAEGKLKTVNIENSSEEGVWSSLIQTIQSKIDDAEQKIGSDLSEEEKDEIIKTALAGSMLGTVFGSPMLVGAALGYAGSQMLKGEKGDKTRQFIGQTSKQMMDQASSAIVYTKQELENEDLSTTSKKILLAVQEKAGQVETELKSSPKYMAEKLKTIVESEEFKSLPNRSFNALKAFLESDEMKSASSSAMKAIKDGLKSDEIKALQSRASKAVMDTIGKSKA